MICVSYAGIVSSYTSFRASLVAWLVKNPPTMQDTPVQFLGQEEGIGYPL